MTSVEAWNSTDGLPKQFLTSLRVLFDILDEKKSGYVRLEDIETRWHEEGVKGLPSGVTDALRKVVPPNGYLSFDRFVSGLKLALLTSSSKPSFNQQSDKENIDYRDSTGSLGRPHRGRLRSHQDTNQKSQQTLPVKLSQDNKPLQNFTTHSSQNSSTVAAVRPNNVHYLISKNGRRNPNSDSQVTREVYQSSNNRPPPRPDRMSPPKPLDNNPPKVPPRGDTSKMIINELKNWQKRINSNQQFKSSNDNQKQDTSPAKNDIYVNISQLNVSDHGHVPPSSSHPSSIKRRDSARRHTLTSGVDSNMIRRAKQLEEEKQVLVQGLAMVDQARLWYIKQIRLLEEKQKYVGKTTQNDYNLEAMQERINFEKARIAEVNHQIKTLVESSEKGFPLHMNLAMSSSHQQLEQNQLKLVKDQNRQLTKEIGQKSDKITQLEQEKAQLVRELFEAQSRNKINYDDTTFS